MLQPQDHHLTMLMLLLRFNFFEKLLEHASEQKFDAHGMEHQVDWQPAVEAVALPEATEAMREAAVETVWRVRRRARARSVSPSPTTSRP